MEEIIKKTIKKVLCILAGLVLVSVVATNNLVASTTGDYQIRVKVVANAVGIEIVDSSLNLSYVLVGTSVTSSPSSLALKSISTVNINLRARIHSSSFTWTEGTSLSDIGADKYVLAMIFHTWNALSSHSNPWAFFDNNDVITTSYKNATNAAGNVFATPDGQPVGTPANADGFGLAPGDQVNSHFFFRAPTSLSNSSQYNQEQLITVRIEAYQ